MKKVSAKTLPSFENIVLFLFMIILPLCMRYVVIPVTGPEARIMNNPVSYDVFHYAKTYLVIGTAIVLSISIAIKVLTGELKLAFGIFQKLILALGAVILLSSVLSPYRELAFQGASDNFENVWVHLSYLALAFVFSQSGKNVESHIRSFAIAAVVVVFMSSVVGMAQSFKINLLELPIFMSYILPNAIPYDTDVFMNTGQAYSFFGNPDYVGSAFALLMPFVLYQYFTSKNVLSKALYGLIFAMGQYTVLAAGALGGILFVPISYILVCGMFIKQQIGNAKRDAVVALAIYIVIGILNYKHNALFHLNEFVIASAIHTAVALVIWLSHVMTRKLFVSLLAASVLFAGFVGFIKLGRMTVEPVPLALKSVQVEGNQIRLETTSFVMYIRNENGEVKAYDGSLNLIETTLNTKKQITTKIEPYNSIILTKNERGGFTVLGIPKYQLNFFVLPNEFRYMNFANIEDEIDEPFIWLPASVSRLGSYRLYIYQGAIALLKESPLIGCGADSFKAAFPQNDVIGRTGVGFSSNSVVDKPHSMYFLYITQFGMVGGVIFLMLLTWVIQKSVQRKESSAIAAFSAVLAYLGIQLINDSKVLFSPYFWILFGLLAVAVQKQSDTKFKSTN